MGLLTWWERRNQKLAHWQNHVESEERSGNPAAKPVPAARMLAIVSITFLLSRVAFAVVGFGPAMIGSVCVFLAMAVAGFILQRRKRMKWEAADEGAGTKQQDW
ncbi:hypothetical protein BH10ACT1_BH10ACT1_24070 [soil metagenome]